MFTTPTNLHNAFLDGIRKSSTTTVKPSVFCRIWNEWAMMEWIKLNTSMREGLELNQKQIDDLRMLYKRVILTPLPGETNMKLPDGSTVYGEDQMDAYTNASVILSKYLRSLVIRFSLNYGSTGNSCGKIGYSGPLKAKYMKADEEGVITESVYRRPADHRLYYKIIGDYILPIVGESPVYQCYLDYIRYPNEMVCSNNVLSYDIDLYPEQLSEVITLAVKIYLERITDPRYKSFLNEEMIRQSTQI